MAKPASLKFSPLAPYLPPAETNLLKAASLLESLREAVGANASSTGFVADIVADFAKKGSSLVSGNLSHISP